jgi:hypothetical protein
VKRTKNAGLKRAGRDEDFARQLRTVLDAEITGVRLRALFDLPDKRPAPRPPESPQDKTG